MLRTVLLTSLFAVVSATTIVDISYDAQTYNVCDGDVARVTWQGYHNIQEVTLAGYDAYDPAQNIGDPVHGFENSGTVLNITGLEAQVDQVRYFVCTAHPNSKFITTCASVIDPTTTTEAATTSTEAPTPAPTTTTEETTTTTEAATTTTEAPTPAPTTTEAATTTTEAATTTIEAATTTTEAPTTVAPTTTKAPITTTETTTTTTTEATTTTTVASATTTTEKATTTTASTPAMTTTKTPQEDAFEIPWGWIALAIIGLFLLGLLVLWCYMTCKDYRTEKDSSEREVLLEMA